MSKRAFVTGATGFLGLNLVHDLCQGGWEVTALHRKSSDCTYLDRFPVSKVEGEITDGPRLLQVLPQGVDAVFHVAANTSVWSLHAEEQTRTNVDGTRAVVAAARERGAKRLVYTSTLSVFGFTEETIDEDTPVVGESSWINYFKTKAMAEKDVIQGGVDWVILNPSHVMGPFDTRNWARLILMVSQDRLPGVPPGQGSFSHSQEVARAHVAAATRDVVGERFVLGGETASFLEVVRILGEILGKKPPTRATPALVLKILGRVSLWVSRFTGKEPRFTPEGVAMVSHRVTCRSDKAEKELGYRVLPVREVVGDACAWLKAEGLLGDG
jgi:nucleoside-diphosphate-sugar epimerase